MATRIRVFRNLRGTEMIRLGSQASRKSGAPPFVLKDSREKQWYLDFADRGEKSGRKRPSTRSRQLKRQTFYETGGVIRRDESQGKGGRTASGKWTNQPEPVRSSILVGSEDTGHRGDRKKNREGSRRIISLSARN